MNHFSDNYAESRRRFLEAASTAGATVSSHEVKADSPDPLSIDAAIIGADGAPTLVISSGVHGAEGFLGSAVQLAVLNAMRTAPPIRYIFIHAVNPYGFAHLRRTNEDNIDLNRNFLPEGATYTGAPPRYAALNAFLNPASPPSRLEPFKLKALLQIARHGMQPLKQAVAGGQYDFPKGLFFGGHGSSQSAQIIRDHCDKWIGESENILHIDFHTGLGTWGEYKLLLAESEDPSQVPWYEASFGADVVEALDPGGTAYEVTGLFGAWMQTHFASRNYRFVGAEFGTWSPIRVLSALRTENRAHFYSDPESAGFRAAKTELLECFRPHSREWQSKVVGSGMRIVEQAAAAISAGEDGLRLPS